MLKGFLGESGVARKDFFIVFILMLDVLGWYYMTLTVVDNILSDAKVTTAQSFFVWSIYYIAVIGSGLVGSVLSKRIGRLKFLYLWMISGVVASALPALFDGFAVTHILIISILLAISFGLGMPSCLAYFADHTTVENRGRIGGIILLITNLSAPLLVLPFGMFDLTVNSIILLIWRGTGLIIFFLKPKENIPSRTTNVSFASILNNKSFLLYFAAWFMFCFVDRFEGPILKTLFDDVPVHYVMIGPIIGSLFSFIGGLLSDWVGRKRVVIYGFATLGIAYAIISVAYKLSFSWYFYLTIGSISTGILWVLFILILWGDLSPSGAKEKYYAVGGIPFFFTNIVRLLSAEYIGPELEPIGAFSLASFFLFLSVLPLLYAPETYPQKKIELRQLRKYAEAARRVSEKYTEN